MEIIEFNSKKKFENLHPQFLLKYQIKPLTLLNYTNLSTTHYK